MKPYFERDGLTIYAGHVINVLRKLPKKSVQCVITSPPYWGLRDYGLPPMVWGGDPKCRHKFEPTKRPGGNGNGKSRRRDKSGGHQRGGIQPGFCRCGAWKGCYGLEPTPELYVEHTVEIFLEIWRVLRDDGTIWLNIGDTYANDAKGPRAGTRSTLTSGGLGIKRTDMIGIPWMVAFALRAAGFYLRSEVIWHKRAPMPSSVKNRPTTAHESIFLLTKKPAYFYDYIASSEETSGTSHARGNGVHKKARKVDPGNHHGVPKSNPQFSAAVAGLVLRRQMRSVWSLSNNGYKGAHFATFPVELVRRALSAGVSEKGCCGKCGSPWIRIVERRRTPTRPAKHSKVAPRASSSSSPYHQQNGKVVGNRDPLRHATETVTVGWKPSCACDAGSPVPCTVLEPFHGAGTTMLVAKRLGLHYVGIELSEPYIDQSIERLGTPIVFPHEREAAKRARKRRRRSLLQRLLFEEASR